MKKLLIILPLLALSSNNIVLGASLTENNKTAQINEFKKETLANVLLLGNEVDAILADEDWIIDKDKSQKIDKVKESLREHREKVDKMGKTLSLTKDNIGMTPREFTNMQFEMLEAMLAVDDKIVSAAAMKIGLKFQIK